MSGYPLKSVLDLRRREQATSEARLADAIHKRLAAEERARLLDERARRALAALHDAERAPPPEARAQVERRAQAEAKMPASANQAPSRKSATMTGAAASTAMRYAARRREEHQRLRDEAAAFRAGPLRSARELEATARQQHLGAWRASEALSKHEARFRLAERQAAGRRDEEAAEEAARAARHERGLRGGRT